LGDISSRAIEVLANADVVACEDTRRTGRLFKHFGIKHDTFLRLDLHTEESASSKVIRRMGQGDSVVFVTDAGTPGISDPGERLVQRVIEAGYEVSIVPGPSAHVAALAASGLSTGRYCMEGFLPRGGTARKERLEELATEVRTIILFEAPHRLVSTLRDLAEAFGVGRRACVAREITKLHEQYVRATLEELAEWAEGQPKGEFVIVVSGASPVDRPDDQRVLTAIRESIERGASTRDAVREVTRLLGVGKRRVYRLALSDSEDSPA